MVLSVVGWRRLGLEGGRLGAHSVESMANDRVYTVEVWLFGHWHFERADGEMTHVFTLCWDFWMLSRCEIRCGCCIFSGGIIKSLSFEGQRKTQLVFHSSIYFVSNNILLLPTEIHNTFTSSTKQNTINNVRSPLQSYPRPHPLLILHSLRLLSQRHRIHRLASMVDTHHFLDHGTCLWCGIYGRKYLCFWSGCW